MSASTGTSVKVGDADASAVTYSGNWTVVNDPDASLTLHETSVQGAAVSLTFEGTSVTAVGQANLPDVPISYLLDGIPSNVSQPTTPRPTDNSSAPFFFIDELECSSHVLTLLVQETGQSVALDYFQYTPCSGNTTTTTTAAGARTDPTASSAADSSSSSSSGPPASAGIAIGATFGSLVIIAALCFVYFGILHKRPKCLARRKKCIPPSQSYLASVGAGYVEGMTFASHHDNSVAREPRRTDQEATGGSIEFSNWMHGDDDKVAMDQAHFATEPSFLPDMRDSRRERAARALSPTTPTDRPPAYSGLG